MLMLIRPTLAVRAIWTVTMCVGPATCTHETGSVRSCNRTCRDSEAVTITVGNVVDIQGRTVLQHVRCAVGGVALSLGAGSPGDDDCR